MKDTKTGDEDMASPVIGNIEIFDANSDHFPSYAERMEQYMIANGNTSNDHIKIILAYSPQENDIQGVTDFYQNLSVQIERAHLNRNNVILVGDFNAKLGSEIITSDPHPMSSSGKLLYEFYTKYNLHLLNSSDVCTGVLTRIQQCKGKIEKSTIDCLYLQGWFVALYQFRLMKKKSSRHGALSEVVKRSLLITVQLNLI